MSGLQGYSKFGNRRSESRDGHTFASKRERDRYEELAIMEAAGVIKALKRQVRHPLIVKGVKVGIYVSDFTYRERAAGPLIVEDVKGPRTQLYLLKKRLMLALYRVEVLET